MKSVLYINIIAFLFSLRIFSQERNQERVFPERFAQEIIQKHYKSNVVGLEKFITQDSRQAIYKKLLGNDSLLKEHVYKFWNGSTSDYGGKL